MLKVGLTGGIGSGKTTVSNLFNKLGIKIIDTDIIAHDLVNKNRQVLKEITDTFGNTVLRQNASLDRKKLAQIVFKQKQNKQKLENILHPKIRNQVSREIQKYSSEDKPPHYIIVVIPLLIETGFHDLINRTLVVAADEKTRIERVRQRDNRDVEEIRAILNSQVSDQTRISAADDVIENNSDFKALESQVQQLHNTYMMLPESGR